MHLQHLWNNLNAVDQNSTSTVNVRLVPTGNPSLVLMAVEGPLTLRNLFTFQEMVREQSAPGLIVDLSEVPYIDSAALGALVGIHVSRDKPGKSYAIAGANERLGNMFRMTDVSKFLVCYPSVDEAIKALA